MAAQRFFTYFLTFVAICDDNILFGATAADGVTQMNHILQHSGWRDLASMEAFVNGDWCNVEQLLLAVDTGEPQLVTDGNVGEKVQQAVGLLSCDYAIMFLTYIVYLYGIGSELYWTNHRNHVGTHEEKQECLDKFRRLFDGDVLVLRMKSAIDYLKSMSPQTADSTDDFSDILASFGCVNAMTPAHYCEQRPSPSVIKRFFCFGGSVDVIDEDDFKPAIDETLKYLEDLKNWTKDFFLRQCGPRSNLSKKIKNIRGSAYSWSLMLTDEYFQDDSSYIVRMNKMYTKVNRIINDFVVLDYAHLGFAFNAESCTTVLNENPDKENRVHRTNEILTHIGKSEHVIDVMIVMDKRQYGVGDLMATEENVEYKLRLIYVFMNCYFVRLLKELLSYKKPLTHLYFAADLAGKFEYFVSFVKTIKKSDPVVQRMRGTLWYFRRLSPRTRFDKDILKIIYFLANSIEMIDLYQSKVYGTKYANTNREKMLFKRMIAFQRNLTEIEIELNNYTESFCAIPEVTDTDSEVPQYSQMEVERQLDEKIKSFKKTELPNLGFNKTHFQALL